MCSTPSIWGSARTRAALAAATCSRARRRPRFARLRPEPDHRWPFADTKEVLGGYYVFDASDLDEVLEFAQRIPAVRLGGAVEARPLVEIPVETAH